MHRVAIAVSCLRGPQSPFSGVYCFWLLLGLVTRLGVIVHTIAYHTGYALHSWIAVLPLWSPSWLAWSDMLLHYLAACVPTL